MIKVLHPGFQSSYQDLGRLGMAKYAVPQSGVMDRYSANFANLLLQNPADTPLIEVCLAGPKLLFETPALLAVAGLEAQVFINQIPVPLHKVLSVKKGDILEVKQVTKGNHLYIACKGGFLTEKVMGSCSYYEAICPSTQLAKGKLLSIQELDASTYQQRPSHVRIRYAAKKLENSILDVFEGPEFFQLDANQKRQLFHQEFHVSKNIGRMAFQLEETLPNQLDPILTSPVIPGTIQLTPSGQLIALMKDAQTTGGYPRILQLSEFGIAQLAQKKQGSLVKFRQIAYF